MRKNSEWWRQTVEQKQTIILNFEPQERLQHISMDRLSSAPLQNGTDYRLLQLMQLHQIHSTRSWMPYRPTSYPLPDTPLAHGRHPAADTRWFCGVTHKTRPLNLSVTLQRINSVIESYATGTTCMILLLPLPPLFTSRKHFALHISNLH